MPPRHPARCNSIASDPDALPLQTRIRFPDKLRWSSPSPTVTLSNVTLLVCRGACLFESLRLDSMSLSTFTTTFSRAQTAMFKDGLYTSNRPDAEEASDPALRSAQRLDLLSALEKELRSELSCNEVVSCVSPNRNAASARLPSAILHSSKTVCD